jgi:hypothetical protein
MQATEFFSYIDSPANLIRAAGAYFSEKQYRPPKKMYLFKPHADIIVNCMIKRQVVPQPK